MLLSTKGDFKMKKLLIKSTPEDNFYSEIGHTVLRVFAGLTMAFGHGLGKIPPHEGFVAAVGKLGFPLPSLFAWSAGLAEFLGGILIAIGLVTRPASFMLFITMMVAAFGQHAADPFAKKEMALLYGAISFYFMLRGSGKLSIDNKIK